MEKTLEKHDGKLAVKDAQVITLLGIVRGEISMNPHLAVEVFAAAEVAGRFMQAGAQKSVNHDYKAQLPAYEAGLDIVAKDIGASEKTRAKFEKYARQSRLLAELVNTINTGK